METATTPGKHCSNMELGSGQLHFKNRYHLDFQNTHIYDNFYRSESCVMSVRHPCSIYTGLVRHVGVLFVSIATGRDKKVIHYYIQVLKGTVLKQ